MSNENSSIIYWAGIGSRDTPAEMLTLMTLISMSFFSKGLVLRSGGAKGADSAFSMGCPKPYKIIYRPQDITAEALEHAKNFHPAWNRCSPYAKKLHARNSMIILGRDLDTPVSFCVCWTKEGKRIGGTAQALRICDSFSIPIYNLGDTSVLQLAYQWLKDSKTQGKVQPFIDLKQFKKDQIEICGN